MTPIDGTPPGRDVGANCRLRASCYLGDGIRNGRRAAPPPRLAAAQETKAHGASAHARRQMLFFIQASSVLGFFSRISRINLARVSDNQSVASFIE